MKAVTRATEDEFRRTCKSAFEFLERCGFVPIEPERYPENRFQVWYRRGDFMVIVSGEGWGEFTSTTIEHSSGVELDIGRLVPKDKRPVPPKNRKKWPGQLELMNRQASWLETYGQDFLGGDATRALGLARPLPPYKMPISKG